MNIIVHFLHLVPYLTVVNPDILSRNVETIRVECSHVYYLSSMMMMLKIKTINDTIYYDDDGGNCDHDEIVTIMMTMTIIIMTMTILHVRCNLHDDDGGSRSGSLEFGSSGSTVLSV